MVWFNKTRNKILCMWKVSKLPQLFLFWTLLEFFLRFINKFETPGVSVRFINKFETPGIFERFINKFETPGIFVRFINNFETIAETPGIFFQFFFHSGSFSLAKSCTLDCTKEGKVKFSLCMALAFATCYWILFCSSGYFIYLTIVRSISNGFKCFCSTK